MQFFVALIVGIGFGSLTAYLAQKQGRDPFLWFVLGLLFGFIPLLSLYLLPFFQGERNAPTPVPLGNVQPNREERESDISNDALFKRGDDEVELGDYELHEWFYLDAEHSQHGPVTFDYLHTCFRENRVTPLTFVWTEGMSQWQKIQEMQPLLDLLDPLNES